MLPKISIFVRRKTKRDPSLPIPEDHLIPTPSPAPHVHGKQFKFCVKQNMLQ